MLKLNYSMSTVITECIITNIAAACEASDGNRVTFSLDNITLHCNFVKGGVQFKFDVLLTGRPVSNVIGGGVTPEILGLNFANLKFFPLGLF